MKKRTFTTLAALMLLAPSVLNASTVLAQDTSETGLTEQVDESVKEDPMPQVPVEVAPEPPIDPTPPVVEVPVQPEQPEPVPTPEPPLPAQTLPETQPAEESVSPSDIVAEGDEVAKPTDLYPEDPLESVEEPAIKVLGFKTIRQGSTFDPMSGVTAYDYTDGDLTKAIKIISNTVNTAKATNDGTPYEVVYGVTNSKGKTTTVTVKVAVLADNYGILTASLPAFSIPRGGDYMKEIEKRIVITHPDGSAVSLADVDIKVTQGFYSGDAGTYQLLLSVISKEFNTVTDISTTVTVVEGLAINVSNREVFRSLNPADFDPLEGVTLTDINENGQTISLPPYDVSKDAGYSIVRNDVDVTTVGTYTVGISAKNGLGIVAYKEFSVTVKDSAVSITATDGRNVTQGTTFDPLEGVVASDEKDGDITKNVTVTGTVDTKTVGSYPVTYAVKNSMGTEATTTVQVNVVERQATVSVKDLQLFVGDVVTDQKILAGVTATDPVDKLEELVMTYDVIDGPIDTSKEGRYQVTISVTNTANVVTTATMTVSVVASTPVITGVKPEQTVTLGEAFDPLTGVTASDPKFGDLTGSIVVTGTVDTAKVGTYDLTYTVANELGKSDTKVATVKVVEPEEELADGADNSGKPTKPSQPETVAKKATPVTTPRTSKDNKSLPQTGELEQSIFFSMLGAFMVGYVFLKKNDYQQEL